MLGMDQTGYSATITGISETLLKSLNAGDRNILARHGVTVVIVNATRHSKVGLAENMVYNIKKALINIFLTHPHVSSLFKLNHRLALIEQFLNVPSSPNNF